MEYYSYDFGLGYTIIRRDSEKVRLSALESKISDLSDVVKQTASREAPQVEVFGMYPPNPYSMDACPTFHYNAGPIYNHEEYPSHDSFDSYPSNYYSGWQDHLNPNEYECGWQEPSFSSYEQEPPTANHSSESSGTFLEDMVKLIAISTTQLFSFQQETQAQIQDLKNQIGEYIASQNRWEWEEEEENEEEGTSPSTSQVFDLREEDVQLNEPVVVPPPFTPQLMEEEYAETWETFTKPTAEDTEVFPSDGFFAEEVPSKRKGTILEIRADFKAPRHHVKTHVWGIDLLDPG